MYFPLSFCETMARELRQSVFKWSRSSWQRLNSRSISCFNDHTLHIICTSVVVTVYSAKYKTFQRYLEDEKKVLSPPFLFLDENPDRNHIFFFTCHNYTYIYLCYHMQIRSLIYNFRVAITTQPNPRCMYTYSHIRYMHIHAYILCASCNV